jgi:hypothetical protein
MLRLAVLLMMGLAAVGLLVVGLNWDRIRPPEAYWSQDRAQDYVAAFSAVHATESEAVNGSTYSSTSEFEAVRKRYDEIKGQLDRARSARERGGKLVLASGLLLLLATIALRHYWPAPPRRADRPLQPLILTSDGGNQRG